MAATIVRISRRRFSVPFKQRLETASASWNVREGVIVRVETSAGHAGIGEASPLPGTSSLRAVEAALDVRGGPLLGAGLRDAWRDLPRDLPDCPPATFALESAILLALAAVSGTAVAGWLAAFAAFPWPPSREPVPVNALVDATGVPVAVERALAAQGSGFRTLKLKVGGDPEADIERVRAVREAVGPAMEIRIDANGGWDEAGAARALAGAARANVALCEQPVARGPGACAAFARLRHIGIPLAADESCRSLPEFAAFLAAGAVDAVVVKPMASGLTEALTVCAVAHSSNCGVIVTSTFDAGPGTLMAMQLAAALPRPLAACGLATLDLLEHPLATGVPPIHAGLIDASALDESVIQLDDEALDRYAAGPWTEIPRI